TRHRSNARLRALGHVSTRRPGRLTVAKAFRRTSTGSIVNLSDGERSILSTIFADTIALLEPETTEGEDPLTAMVGITESAGPPTDAALARLLPDGSTVDDEDADEF